MLLLLAGQATWAQGSCAAAVPISGAGTFTAAPITSGEIPNPVCAENGNGATGGEWYKYTPAADHTVTVSSDLAVNTGGDTRVHVYSGTCGALACLAGDDDSGSGYLSVVSFNVVAGETYYIAWDNKWNSGGFTWTLAEGDVIVPPPTPVQFSLQAVPTINSSYNICVVDVNNDHLDDIVGVTGNNLRIHYQNPDHTFTVTDIVISGAPKSPSWSMAAGDYNRDGYADFILGSGNGLSVLRSGNNGTSYSAITPGEFIFCQRTNFVDINNDGNLDVFSCHDVNPNVYYLADASGNLTYYQSSITPGAYQLGNTPSGGNYSSLWTDLDNDGDVDMFMSKCSGPPCEIHRNDGNGVFTDVSAQAQINFQPVTSWSSAIADFDNDGDMDIMIGSNGGTPSKLFRNNLDTTNSIEEAYTNITAGSGWDTDGSTNRDYVAYDFDNDGRVDVLGGGGKIMFNMGNMTFAPIPYSGMQIGAVGDLNNDGFLDILSVNGGSVRYAVPNGNHWFAVALQGTESNQSGIGARVELYGAWGKQIRDIRSGEGFGYMGTMAAHFGMGAATEIEKVRIVWPSGTVDVIHNPTPDQKIFVLEGSSPELGVGAHDQAPFSIYPNPVKDVLNIGATTISITSAEIYDLTGRRVFEGSVTNNALSLSKLASGTYVATLRDAQGHKYVQKFIKN